MNQMNTEVKSILGLRLPTDPRLVDLAAMSLSDILTDHDYSEHKAASTCISLIVQYADKAELVSKLSPLVTEEWGHFRMVLQELSKRGLKLGHQRKDEYVSQLLKFIRKGDSDGQLMDKLLVCAMIEARSCERFKRLSEGLPDELLREFYRSLMISEAGHYRLFIDLAKDYFKASDVDERWHILLDCEREILEGLELRGDRVH